MKCKNENCPCCNDIKSEKSYEFLNGLLVQNYNQRLQVLAFALIMSLALLSGFYDTFTDSFQGDNNLAPIFVIFVSILITYVVKLLECRNKETKDVVEKVIKDTYRDEICKAIDNTSRYVKFSTAIDSIFYILYVVQGVSLGLFLFLYKRDFIETYRLNHVPLGLFIVLIICHLMGKKIYSCKIFKKQKYPHCVIDYEKDCFKWEKWSISTILVFFVSVAVFIITVFVSYLGKCFSIDTYLINFSFILLLSSILILYCMYRQCLVWECTQVWNPPPKEKKCCNNKKRFEGALSEFWDMTLIILISIVISNNCLNHFDLSFKNPPNIYYEVILKDRENSKFERVSKKMNIHIEEKHFLEKLTNSGDKKTVDKWCEEGKQDTEFGSFRITKRFLQGLRVKGLIDIEKHVKITEEGKEFLNSN